MSSLIYVTEDDLNIREVLRCTLESFGYEVECFEEGGPLFQALERRVPQLFLLDIMLPGEDGLTLLRHLRGRESTREIPVILLTAKTTEVDKVVGLDGGADDYITKPFGILELTARVRAALRRRRREEEPTGPLRYRDLCLDVPKRQVTRDSEPLELTLKEFELLRLLMENTQRAMAREDLLSAVWGYDFVGESRTLDMHIKTLRQKLGDDADHPRYIKTIRGIGYTMV